MILTGPIANRAYKYPGIGRVKIITSPIPGLAAIVGLAAFRPPGYRAKMAPGFTLGQINLTFFLLGKLIIGNKFFQNIYLLRV